MYFSKMFENNQSNCNLWKYFQWDGKNEWECKVNIPDELSKESMEQRDVTRHPPLERVAHNQEFPFYTDTPLQPACDKIRVYFSTDSQRKVINYLLVDILQSSRVYKITSVSVKIKHATSDGVTNTLLVHQLSNATGNPTAFPFWFHHQGSRLKDALYLTITLTVKQADFISLLGSVLPPAIITKRPSTIPNKYSKFYGSSSLVDVTLIHQDGSRYPCHRLILADNSPVFAQMFKYETKETRKGEVEIEGVSKKTMKEFLEFLYTGTCDSLEKKVVKRAIKLYLTADRYLVDDLKYLCAEVMESGVTVENCLTIWELANCFQDLHRIKRTLTEFSLAHRKLGGKNDTVFIALAKKCLPQKLCGSGCSFCDN